VCSCVRVCVCVCVLCRADHAVASFDIRVDRVKRFTVLQYVAVCCVLQCVAVRCRALQCVVECCRVLQCVAASHSVL